MAVALATAALLLTSVAHADAGENRIHAVEHGRAGKAAAGATVVRIRGSQRPTFAVYTLQGPSRVVVDVAGAVLDDRLTTAGGSMANWPVSGWAVSQVSAYELQGQEDGASRNAGRGLVRIVVDMARPGTYHAKADGRDVVVTVIPREPEPAGASPAEAARAAEAVREAESRRREVIAAIEDAEERRARAEALRVQAEERRAAVEKELHEAEQKRARAEAAATEAARRAEQARALREREEVAYRDASTARAEAERRTADATRAGKRLAELEAAAKDAKDQAASLRRAADQAARKAAEVEERKSASEREIARARSEAERLAKARAEAEGELERRRREVAEQASEAERLVEARAKAESELKALDGAAAKARREREAEETRIAKLTRQRQDLEREVEGIRQRVRAEAQAEREAQRREAEAELKALDGAAEKSRHAREAEEARIAELAARRQELERELAKARSTAEAERAARRSKAAAELESLDGAAEKSRRARQEEEARIAELAARRQELERELAKARSAAEAERAARRSKAEAELKALDGAAEKVRRARQEEEAQIAELAARRQELERDLERMREQARAAASSEAAARARAEAAQQAESKAKAEARASVEAAQKAETKAKAAARAEAEAKAEAAARAEAAQQAEASAKAKASVAVQDIDFTDRGEVARVVIDLASDARTRVVSSKGKRAILEIDGVTLPAKLQRTLDIRPYRGPIQAISSYRHPKDRSRMRVVVDLAYPVKSALKRNGSTYYWDFAKPAPAGPARAAVARNTPDSRPRARTQSYPAPVVGGYGASSTPITQKTVAQLANQGRKVYRGTKIDLDLKDVDIHNVMRLLADVGGINIVVPDDVKAQVTVRLRQVPWDQALEVVLASKGLWFRREGNLYRIAPRKQLDSEDQAEAERLAAMVKAEAPEPQIFTLNYAVADDIKAQLEPLLSPKGRIEVDERTNSLIINDVRAHRQRMIDLLTRLDTQTPQIQIEARIVEARSTFVRELGVQWGGRFTDSDGLVVPGGVAGGAVDGQTVTSGILAANPDFAVNLPAAVGSGAGGALGLTLGSLGGAGALTLRLSALEDSGSVRIISAPKITVLNNIQAEISQGVSIPISVISAQGVQTQFVPADLTLKVTPHVSQRDCSIAMELEVAKNEADFVNTGARGDPTILRKEAKTTVLVADNETSVLGGIYTRNSGLSYSKVPLLGDLPILGWLFKNRRENDERTEVLLFVTPRITNKAFLRCE